MKEYSTIEELKNEFVEGGFKLESIRLGEAVFQPITSTKDTFSDMISDGYKGAVIYESEDAGWLMFLWGNHNNSLVPYDVRQTTLPITEADISAIEDRIIPDKVEVHFLNLPISGSVIAKVDTGAEMCSLHAEQVQINRGEGTVTFVCPQLAHSRITAPMTDRQAIKTSGGDTTYRAVITVSLKIKGKIMKDMQVNLNDRSEMDSPMLLGQNALQAGKFLIDPNIIKEGRQLLSEEFVNELKKDVVVLPETKISEETAQKLYEALNEVGDIEIGKLMRLLRTQVLKNLNDVSY